MSAPAPTTLRFVTEVVELERLAARAWPAAQTRWLGAWLLRASSGWTRRANSVLVLGEPDRELSAALTVAHRWYADRGLPLLLGVPLPSPAEGLERLGTPEVRTRVLTATTRRVGAAGPPDARVEVLPTMSPAWRASFDRRRPLVDGTSDAVLTGPPATAFAALWRGSGPTARIVAQGRLAAVGDGWAGLDTIWVEPSLRGGGLGRSVTVALAHVAAAHGIPRLFLQVEADNAPALALYVSLGFVAHHDYVYLRAPSDDPVP